jgi:Na+-driven multidrug efflux pump
MALLCVLFINPTLSFLLAEWMGIGVWGIWYATLITQAVWFVMSLVWGRKCLNRIQEGRQDG